ncbi:DUF6980 family protein [Sphingomonas sp. PB4P5]|uniref:DUF6980 family protein n=1 Tax=Parasphingomonas puruogangriensis TaxID=3096155 RepID=UPI003FA6FECB
MGADCPAASGPVPAISRAARLGPLLGRLPPGSLRRVHAGEARQSLFYCPWSGEKLPPTQRDRWFDELEALGLDPWHDEVPERFRSDAWRKATGPVA